MKTKNENENRRNPMQRMEAMKPEKETMQKKGNWWKPRNKQRKSKKVGKKRKKKYTNQNWEKHNKIGKGKEKKNQQ